MLIHNFEYVIWNRFFHKLSRKTASADGIGFASQVIRPACPDTVPRPLSKRQER